MARRLLGPENAASVFETQSEERGQDGQVGGIYCIWSKAVECKI